MIKKVDVDYYGRPLSIEVGKLAKQADGAALVRYGETVVLVTAVAAKELRRDTDFFPLTAGYPKKTIPTRWPCLGPQSLFRCLPSDSTSWAPVSTADRKMRRRRSIRPRASF